MNGTAHQVGFNPTPPTEIERKRIDLREQIKLKVLEKRLIKEKGELRDLKEQQVYDLDWVSPWVRFLQDLGSEGSWLPISSPTSRRKGDNYPMFRTEQELALHRDLSRIMAAVNNHAIGLMGGLLSFVIGDGMAHQVTPGEGGSKELARKVQNWTDDWSGDELWSEHQQEIFTRDRMDGESFVRVFQDADEQRPCIRYIWPEQVTKRPTEGDINYSYGIRTAKNDIAKPVAYWVADPYNPADGEEVDAKEIFHQKWNVLTGIKRGMPDFSFSTKDALAEAARLTKNMGAGAASREAVSWVQQHATATEAQVNAWVTSNADQRKNKPTGFGAQQAGAGKTISVNVDDPATVYNVPAGLQLVAMAGPAGAETHIKIVQLLLRAAGTRWNAPEWLTSGDASNMGAYTSSLVAESPFVRRIKMAQGIYRRRYIRLLKRVVLVAEQMNLLPAGASTKCRFELTPPVPEVRNKLEDANVDQIYFGMGVKSPQRISREQAFDYDKDLEEINSHIDATSDYGLPLPLPASGGTSGFDVAKTTNPTLSGQIDPAPATGAPK